MNTYKYVKSYRANSEINEYCEMSVNEIGFLCGLIRDNKPHKIVEVGVSSGGTTVEILKCINELGLDCKMYSVDLSVTHYKYKDKECGYFINEFKKKVSPCSYHMLLTGSVLPARFDIIGDDIDFLIIDTTHILPGEILDFLVAYHHLSSNAIVVLHDTILHYSLKENFDDSINGNSINGINAIATNLLFSCVVADKYCNNHYECDYPNIAAFRLNDDTDKYIINVFNSLMLPWAYLPDKCHLELYSDIFRKEYPNEMYEIWQQALQRARELLSSDSTENVQTEYIRNIVDNRRILLYGAGYGGEKFCKMFTAMSCNVVGFVVSDGQKKQDLYCGKPVFYFSDIPSEYDDCMLINAVYDSAVNDIIYEQKKYKNARIPLRMWESCLKYSDN